MKGAIFTYALAYGGAAVSLINPFVGLLIYVCFGILKPDALWSWSLPEGGHFSRIVAIALLLGWGFNGFGRWELGKARGIVLAFVGFWALIAAGVLKLTSLKAADVSGAESSEVPETDLWLNSPLLPPDPQNREPVGAAGKDRSVIGNAGVAATWNRTSSPPAFDG